MADRKAKIQAEMDRIKAEKAAGKKKEVTTPKTRATTPVRAPKEDSGGAEPPAVDPAKAAAAAKRKAKIMAEKEKSKAAKKTAADKRATTPTREAPKADGATTKAGGGAKERREQLLKERQARTKAKKEAAAAAKDGGGAAAAATEPKAVDPQTPPTRPADAPAAAAPAAAAPAASASKSKKMTQKEKIEAKKEEIKLKRAKSKSKAGGSVGSSASTVASSDAASDGSGSSEAPQEVPQAPPETPLALELEHPEEDGDEPPPLPAPVETKAKKKNGKKNAKKAATTPPRPNEPPPVDKTEILQRLHASADTGDFQGLQQAVQDAVKARIDLNTRDPTRDNCTAVYLAAKGGHAQLIQLLQRNGAELMPTGSMAATPLFIACYHGFADVVGVIADNLPTDERWRAAEDYLVDGEIKIRKGDIFKPDNYTPNNRGGFEGVIQGSDQDWPREGTERAKLPASVFERTTERAIQLEKKVDDSSPFFIACQEGHVKAATILFEAGVDIEEPDRQGATPFYSACQQGNLGIVRYLFGKENPRTGEILDPEKGLIVGGLAETPRDTAERFNRHDIITFLNEPYKTGPGRRAVAAPQPGTGNAGDIAPEFDREYDDVESDTDDERDLLRKMPGMGNDMAPVMQPMSPGRGPGTPGGNLLQEEEAKKLKTIKRGKTKTLDLAMRRRGSVYSAGFLVEDDESEEFEADGEEEDETRLRLTQLTRAVLFVGIAVFATLSHFAPGLLVLTAILSVLLIAAPAHYANSDISPGLPGGKTQRTVPAVQLGLCLFISIFAGAAQFVPGVLVILSTLILLLLAAPASKDDGTKKHTWR